MVVEFSGYRGNKDKQVKICFRKQKIYLRSFKKFILIVIFHEMFTTRNWSFFYAEIDISESNGGKMPHPCGSC